MSCLKVGAQVGRPSWMIRLTIFRKIRLLRGFSKYQRLISCETDKARQKVILGLSNLEDWIIFDDFLWKTNISQW